MIAPQSDDSYLSPVEYACRLGVKPERVRTWIKSGALRAVNVGDKSRPRFRIAPSAIAEFEELRSGKQTVPPPSRKRKAARPGFVKFF
jgi:hypothetical protein